MEPNHITKITEIIERRTPIYVAFSGGFDSTLLVDELFRLMTKNDIYPKVYLVSTNFTSKENDYFYSPSENGDKLARRRLIELFNWKYPKVKFDTINLFISATTSNVSEAEYNSEKGALCLQLNQFSYILTIMQSESNLLLGYIRGDHGVSESKSIYKLIDDYNELLYKNIKLEIPFYRYDKATILSYLIDNPLITLCHTCDSPYHQHELGHNCDCESCNTVKAALFKLSEKGTLGSNKYTDLLKEWYGINISYTDTKNCSKKIENITT